MIRVGKGRYVFRRFQGIHSEIEGLDKFLLLVLAKILSRASEGICLQLTRFYFQLSTRNVSIRFCHRKH